MPLLWCQEFSPKPPPLVPVAPNQSYRMDPLVEREVSALQLTLHLLMGLLTPCVALLCFFSALLLVHWRPTSQRGRRNRLSRAASPLFQVSPGSAEVRHGAWPWSCWVLAVLRCSQHQALFLQPGPADKPPAPTDGTEVSNWPW